MNTPHDNIPQHASSRIGWSVLALGLAVTVAQWAVGYVALMQPGLLLGEALFAVMLLMVIGGGALGKSAVRGLLIGLVAAGFNLLIVGSLIGRGTDDAFANNALLWVGGMVGSFAVLGIVGGVIGQLLRGKRHDHQRPNYYGLLTKIVVVAAFLLLTSGGIVTGFEAGLAVPDWPNSFGHNMLLYPLTQMVSKEGMAVGVHYEHAHRLYGMLVGLSTLTLAVTIWFADHRRWVRLLCLAALVMVIIQGVLGGTRVTETNVTLALIHGIFGQVFFATLMAIAAVTSTTWITQRGLTVHENAAGDRKLSTILLVALLGQLTLGATYRHLHHSPDMQPGVALTVLTLHILVALAIFVIIVLIVSRTNRQLRGQKTIRKTTGLLGLCVGVQFLLGIASAGFVMTRKADEAIPTLEVVFTTMHQATGALLLALATLYWLWTRRLLVEESR